MRSTLLVTAALAATFLAAPLAHAQRADVPEPTPNASSFAAAPAPAPAPVALAERGPTMQSAAIAPKLDITGENEAALAAARRPFGLSQTLMIVGGAAFLAGAIIGDDAGTVMMVGGAGVGLYGLYLYLRQPSGVDSHAIGVGYSIPMGH